MTDRRRRGSEGHEDPVTANRAQHPRQTPPGRQPTGWPVTQRWIRLTAAVVVVATVVLVVMLALGGA